MSNVVTVLGFGAVGRASVNALIRAGRKVVVSQRSRPADLPAGTEFRGCDVLDAASVASALRGSNEVVLAIGFPYSTRAWHDCWPKAMANVLGACAHERSRLVFVDNLYMYGPQSEPLREEMPLAGVDGKPGIRAAITRQWLAAAGSGQVKVAALRAPDLPRRD